jgi:hypothetical protein
VFENKLHWHGIIYYLTAIPLVLLFRYILQEFCGLDGLLLILFSATLGFLAADMPELVMSMKKERKNKKKVIKYR